MKSKNNYAKIEMPIFLIVLKLQQFNSKLPNTLTFLFHPLKLKFTTLILPHMPINFYKG